MSKPTSLSFVCRGLCPFEPHNVSVSSSMGQPHLDSENTLFY